MITKITRWIGRFPVRRRYWAVEEPAYELVEQLYGTDDPDTRASILGQLADIEDQLADMHMDAFGPEVVFFGPHAVYGHGVTTEEHELWRRLGATRDRAERAQLLVGDIWQHATRRVGGQATEVLVTVADTEAQLAGIRLPALHDW